MASRHPVYLAFQGGGAKGISHIGGLAAVNELGLEIAGVAGTSAGAIVAALVAAKCSSRDILDIETGAHILQRIAGGAYANPTSLFTPKGWAEIQFLLRQKKWLTKVIGKFASVSRGLRMGMFFILLTTAVTGIIYWPRSTLGLLGLLTWWVAHHAYIIYQGFAPLTAVQCVIDEGIAVSLGIEKKHITFADLKAHNGLPLKLVATNLTDGCLELFSYETTPYVVIADAVAASVRLPFIFKPWSMCFQRHDEIALTERWFLDGGLMSNLPVWSFDEERALDRQAVSIGFGLNTKVPDASGEKNWMLAALDAIIDGPPQIHLRGIDRFIHIPLDCSLGLMDFDANLTQLIAEVHRAKEKAIWVLKQELTEIPELMRQALTDMQTTVWAEICNGNLGLSAIPEKFPHILLAIQRPRDRKSFTVAYDSSPDEFMKSTRISLDNSIAGDAWRKRADNEACFDVYLPDAGDANRKCDQHGGWSAVVPVPIVDPKQSELADAELAVVVIINSAEHTDLHTVDSAELNVFANDLHRLSVAFFRASDFGRLARRSVMWL